MIITTQFDVFFFCAPKHFVVLCGSFDVVEIFIVLIQGIFAKVAKENGKLSTTNR